MYNSCSWVRAHALRRSARVILLCGIAATAQAADTAEADAIVVTATRTARTVDETLAPVTVVTRRDIERLQARSVEEVLRGVEGVTLVNTGGPGKLTSVFMRGASSSQVLVLIDGIKAGSPTSGMMAFQDLPIEQIERIEIVRGPRSSLYGSEAVGGVIQIFTKRGGGALAPSFSVGGGSFRTGTATAGISGGGDRAWFNVSASGFSTEGIDACRGDPVTFRGCAALEPDKDGYRNVSQAARAGYRFDNGTEAEVHALHAAGRNKYDGFVNESHVVQEAYGTRLRFAPLKDWRVTAAAGRSADKSDNYKDAALDNRIDTERDTVSLQNDMTLPNNQSATLGVDRQQDRVTGSTATYSVTSRDNRGVFGQIRFLDGAHDLQASLRRDVNEQFGTHGTRAIAWGYAVKEGLRVVASHGTAFKAPTFNDLYYVSPFFNGNPNLKPERSQTAELGLRGTWAQGRWSLNAFQTDIRDLIVIAPSFTTMDNVEQARIRGLEAGWTMRNDAWELGAQATALRPENVTPGASYGRTLPRRASRTGRIDLDRRLGAHRLGMSVVGEGRRYDDAGNTIALGGYALVDLRAEYALDKSWRLQAKAANLLDTHYETAAYYNQPGRAFYLTLRYQPARP